MPSRIRSFSLRVLGLTISCTLSILLFQNCSKGALNSDAIANDQSGGSSNNSSNNLLACAVPPVTITHKTKSAVQATQINYLNTATYPTAVCNDGSAAMYAFRPGFGAGHKRWVIFLQGGGGCYDQATCSARAASSPPLVSTLPYQNHNVSLTLSNGLLSNSSALNPDFYDANIVEIAYCSSDLWSGVHTAAGAFNPDDVGTWTFQGHAIISSVIQDLKLNHGLSKASELLLSGGSAGGLGVFYNYNDILAQLPSNIRTVASPDAGYFIKVAPYLETNPPTYLGPIPPTNEITTGMVIWNGHGEKGCDDEAVTTDDHIACYIPQNLVLGNRYPGPLLIRESLEDTNQLASHGIVLNNGVTTQPGGDTYVEYFAQQMSQDLQGFDPLYSVFGINELSHVVYTGSEFTANNYTFPTANGTTTTSISAALGTWYRNPCSSMQLIQTPQYP